MFMVETERMLVRRLAYNDLEYLIDIFSDPVATRYYGAGRPLTYEETAQLLDQYVKWQEGFVSAPGLVLLKSSMEVIGFGGVGYYPGGNNTADLFFIFKEHFWGRGLATELAKGAITHAFTQAQVMEIFATTRPANIASIRVLEKCGMILQKFLPEIDRLLYSLERDRQ